MRVVMARDGRTHRPQTSAASRAEHHNSVLRRSTKRARELEPKLARILEPILAGVGDEAASKFEAHVTDYLAAAARPSVVRVPAEQLASIVHVQMSDEYVSSTPGVTRQSTMIALKPRPEEASLLEHQQIAAPELHVTLCYLGETEMPLERLQALLAAVAASHAPLAGSVAGIAAFAAGEHGHPSIVLPSVPGLVELRVAVTEALAGAGIDFSREYGYIPHMTVAYSDQSEDAIAFPSVDSFGVPLHFDSIHIVRGDIETIELPLTGGKPITAAALETSNPVDDLFAYAREHKASDGLQYTERFYLPHRVKELLAGAAVGESDMAKAIGEVAAEHAPDGGYGDTFWNAGTKTVAWISADWTSNEEEDAAIAAFLEIDGVDDAYSCAECAAPPADEWEPCYRSSALGAASLLADAHWSAPVGDELVDVDALVKKLRTKTDPVRLAVIETAMTAALEGVGLEWDATNPFTAKVLAQSGSQIVNIAKSTQLNVMRIIRASYDEGLSIRDTAKAIRAGMKEASVARSLLIARTELAGAVNGGSVAATQIVSEATGVGFEKVWKTAEGAHFPRHEEYDGLDEQSVGLDDYFDVGGAKLQFPGDPDGPPEEICNCFVGSTSVVAPGLQMGFRRRYEGDLVRLEVEGVGHLAGTPNHPVLTSAGWKPLGLLREGDHLVSAVPREHEGAVDPDVDHAPAAIQDVFGALASREMPRRIRGRAVQFHGDPSADRQVEVVSADGDLGLRIDPALSEQRGQLEFAGAGEASGLLSPARLGGSLLLTDRPGATGFIGGAREGAPLAGVDEGHPHPHRLGAPAERDAAVEQYLGDGLAGDAMTTGERLYGGSFEVSLAKIVGVERQAFHGDVFNLQTETGTYLANGIVSHNCRCTVVYVEQGVEVGEESAA